MPHMTAGDNPHIERLLREYPESDEQDGAPQAQPANANLIEGNGKYTARTEVALQEDDVPEPVRPAPAAAAGSAAIAEAQRNDDKIGAAKDDSSSSDEHADKGSGGTAVNDKPRGEVERGSASVEPTHDPRPSDAVRATEQGDRSVRQSEAAALIAKPATVGRVAVDTERPGDNRAERKPERQVARPKPGTELRLIPEGASAPTQLPAAVSARVETVVGKVVADPAYTKAAHPRLDNPVDVVSFMVASTKLEVDNMKGAQSGAATMPADQSKAVVLSKTDIAVAKPNTPTEVIITAAGDLEEKVAATPSQDPFLRRLAATDLRSVAAELTTENKSPFAEALEQADPGAFLEGLGTITDHDYWRGLRSDPEFYYNMYRAQSEASRRRMGYGEWQEGHTEVRRAKEEADYIAALRGEYTYKSRTMSGEQQVELLRKQIDNLNALDEQMFSDAFGGLAGDQLFRGEAPSFVSPNFIPRMKVFMSIAYGLLARPPQGSREKADMYVIGVLDEVQKVEAGRRHMSDFMADPVGWRAGKGSSSLSERYLRDKAELTRATVDFLFEHGNPREASLALLGAYMDVDEAGVKKLEQAAYRGDREGFLTTGQLSLGTDWRWDELRQQHWDRMKELAGLRYGIRLRHALTDDEERGERAADYGLLQDYKDIIDGRARERASLAFEPDRASWIGGNRPPIQGDELADVAEYTALLLGTTLRWEGADAAAERLREMIQIVADRQIALLQTAQHQSDPSLLHQGILPSLTEDILTLRAAQAQMLYREILQRGGLGQARQFMEDWFKGTRDLINGEALKQAFFNNPAAFMADEGEIGLHNADLESLPSEELARMRSEVLSILGKAAGDGAEVDADSSEYRWFLRLNGILAYRDINPAGAAEESHLGALQRAARTEQERRVLDQRLQNRIHLVSQRGGAGLDAYAILAASYPHVAVITGQGEVLRPTTRQLLIDTAFAEGRVLDMPERQSVSRNSAAGITVVDIDAPGELLSPTSVLGGIGPGGLTAVPLIPGSRLGERIVDAIQSDPANFGNITCVVSPSGTMTVSPFNISYNPDDGQRTMLLFRDEADGSQNHVLSMLVMRAAAQLARQ